METDNGYKRFVEYYETRSVDEETQRRSLGILEAIIRERQLRGAGTMALRIGDVGCNTGAQAQLWAVRGHKVQGVDVSRELIEIARNRAKEAELDIECEVGSATQLPWENGSIDVCLLPELLEHVPEWEKCLEECVRVAAPGASIYISTTNKLCPKQQEFALPLYSWYPGFLKRHFETLATSSRRELVNFAEYPAVNWFTFYGLAEWFRKKGLAAKDRFDLLDVESKGRVGKIAVGAIMHSASLRFLAQTLTPYTVVVAIKDVHP